MPGLFLLEAGANTAIDSTAWSDVITAITNQVSVSSVVGVLAVAAGASIGLVFMWWGVRKATKVLMSAFKRGKLRV